MKQWMWILAGLGCAACCAPLLAPLLGLASASAGMAWLAGFRPLEVVCAVLLALAAAGAVVWGLRRHARRCAVDGPCNPAKRG